MADVRDRYGESTLQKPVDGIKHCFGGGNRRIASANDGAADQFVATLVYLSQGNPQVSQVRGPYRRKIEGKIGREAANRPQRRFPNQPMAVRGTSITLGSAPELTVLGRESYLHHCTLSNELLVDSRQGGTWRHQGRVTSGFRIGAGQRRYKDGDPRLRTPCASRS